MQTIREIKEKTEVFFASKGVPDPKLDADILIAHFLGIKRLELYLDLDRPLTANQLDALRPLVKRRASREPLQYILGSVRFGDLSLKVDRRALIPRPETEELLESLTSASIAAPGRIIDLGTGSGALALALAAHFPEAVVMAVDCSPEALSLAQENAQALGLDERICFLEGSWWAPVAAGELFDWIVSNPPYLTENEWGSAEPEVREYEPHGALASGTDGLDAIRAILEGASQHLAPGGRIALETGIAQREALDAMAEALNLVGESRCDLSGRPRFYFASRRSDP